MLTGNLGAPRRRPGQPLQGAAHQAAVLGQPNNGFSLFYCFFFIFSAVSFLFLFAAVSFLFAFLKV
jgi:hypothetical protein